MIQFKKKLRISLRRLRVSFKERYEQEAGCEWFEVINDETLPSGFYTNWLEYKLEAMEKENEELKLKLNPNYIDVEHLYREDEKQGE